MKRTIKHNKPAADAIAAVAVAMERDDYTPAETIAGIKLEFFAIGYTAADLAEVMDEARENNDCPATDLECELNALADDKIPARKAAIKRQLAAESVAREYRKNNAEKVGAECCDFVKAQHREGVTDPHKIGLAARDAGVNDYVECYCVAERFNRSRVYISQTYGFDGGGEEAV